MNTYIVIGAGVLGASTAYHLSKMGVKVTVIDAKDRGQATDAAAGVVCPWLSQRRNKAWYTLAKNGAAYFSTLINSLKEDGETDTGYKKVGAICIHNDKDKLQKMEERALKRREDAPEIGEVRQISEEETARLFPPLKEGYSAVYVSGGARVDGRALTKSLLNAAKKHGAQVEYGKAEIVDQDGPIWRVSVNGKTMEASKVIVTAGAWADQLLAPLGIHFQLKYQKGQVVHLDMNGQDTNEWPVVMPPGDQGILAFNGGEVVIGSTHENDVGFDLRITAGGLHEILDKALSVAPGLADGSIKDIRVGFRPFTPNFLPVFGEVPGFNGLLTANGLGASGLTVGPYLGFQLACLALGKPLELDSKDYDLANAIH